jgi:hypothetical protein
MSMLVGPITRRTQTLTCWLIWHVGPNQSNPTTPTVGSHRTHPVLLDVGPTHQTKKRVQPTNPTCGSHPTKVTWGSRPPQPARLVPSTRACHLGPTHTTWPAGPANPTYGSRRPATPPSTWVPPTALGSHPPNLPGGSRPPAAPPGT